MAHLIPRMAGGDTAYPCRRAYHGLQRARFTRGRCLGVEPRKSTVQGKSAFATGSRRVADDGSIRPVLSVGLRVSGSLPKT